MGARGRKSATELAAPPLQLVEPTLPLELPPAPVHLSPAMRMIVASFSAAGTALRGRKVATPKPGLRASLVRADSK
jgi:hypothetical protein